MNIALIVAAGSSLRMGNVDTPKQFINFEGKPLLIYSVDTFNKHNQIDAVVIVTSNDYIEQVNNWCKEYKLNKVKAIVSGGSTRQESVYNGLKAMKDFAKDNDIVLIHDAARPLISEDIISNNISACEQYDAVTTVIKANDTIVHSTEGESINDVPKRKELYQSQTPQTFKYSLIMKAHESVANSDATDDTQLVLSLNRDVYLVLGDKRNFKVTTPEDLLILKALK